MESLNQLHETICQQKTAALQAIVENLAQNAPAQVGSIYFLMNLTMNTIDSILSYYLLHSGFSPRIQFGQYDNIEQEVFDPASKLHQQSFDLVVCALYYDPLDPSFIEKLNSPNQFIVELKNRFDMLDERLNVPILINTFPLPLFSEMGITSTLMNDRVDSILAINAFIKNYVKQSNQHFFLADWNQYIQIVGEKESFDYRYAYLYQAPFRKAFLSHYAKDMTKILRALYGKTKKCLILDCDNTLWGGIIGEDGLGGIQLDNHHYPGKVFYDFHQSVITLAERGVILALCSKNNEQDVWEVFEKHPYCRIKKDHIAIAKINWTNKADNIIAIANELNISIGSCVLLDDSSTECEITKCALPELTVTQVPNPLYQYPSLLFREGLFDSLSLHQTDVNRNKQYQNEAKRKAILARSNNMDEYLVSLQLVANIHRAEDVELPRIAQLTQKTNQFNLSTQRYTQQQIETFAKSKQYAIYTLQAKDKFGDYGLTGVLIAKYGQQTIQIDTLLMSCRILSRNLEFVFLYYCLKDLENLWATSRCEAVYKPTTKNSQIITFLEAAGFQSTDQRFYTLDLLQWDLRPVQYILVNQYESNRELCEN